MAEGLDWKVPTLPTTPSSSPENQGGALEARTAGAERREREGTKVMKQQREGMMVGGSQFRFMQGHWHTSVSVSGQ